MDKKNFWVILFLPIIGAFWLSAADTAKNPAPDILKITPESALSFTKLALKCIGTEYPNKPGHVINNDKEVKNPRSLHPAFFGCFDWHSAVHGHWMLVRILKHFPDLPNSRSIRDALTRNLTAENIQAEVDYFKQPGRKSFERMYGWAWLLKLVEELHGWEDEEGTVWRRNLEPLEKEIVLSGE